MEQIAATYSRRRNPSLAATEASTVSQTLGASQWTAFTQQQNVPGFLLLDAIRFYKKGQTTGNQLAPVVETLRKESDDIKQKVDTLLHDVRSSQKRLGRVEHTVEEASKDLGNMDRQIDTVRRDNLRTNTATNRNNQEVDELAVRFNVLERELMGLRAREKDTMDLRAEMRTLVAELSAIIASVQPLATPPVERGLLSSHVMSAVSASSVASQYDLGGGVEKQLNTRRYTALPEYPGSHSQPSQNVQDDSRQTGQPVAPSQVRSSARIRGQAGDAFSSAVQSRLVAAVTKPNAALPSQGLAPHEQGDETASEASEADTASEVSATEAALPAGAKARHAALADLLKQAQKRHASQPRLSDQKLIWGFLDDIGDRDLSKQLQLSLPGLLGPKLVGKSHASLRQCAARNRFVTVAKLKWPQFAKAVGEFLKTLHG